MKPTTKEANKAKRMLAAGVPKKEVQARLEQSAVDKALAARANPGKRRNRRKKGDRFSFGLSNLEVGPLSLGGASFSSRKGRSGTIGVATRSKNVQVVMPRLSSASGGNGSIDILTGTEYLESLSIPAEGVNEGDLLARILINPNAFLRTRLNQFGPLYQRYRFRKLNFHYEPVVPTTQAGQLIGFADYDVSNMIDVDSPDNVSIAAAHFSEGISQVWEPRVFTFGVDHVRDGFTSLYTSLNGDDERFIYQGVFYMFAASKISPSDAAAMPLGNIYISYDIEFSVPQLSTSELARIDMKIFSGVATLTETVPENSSVPMFPVDNFQYGPAFGIQPNFDNYIVETVGTYTQILLSGVPEGRYLLWGSVEPANSDRAQIGITYPPSTGNQTRSVASGLTVNAPNTIYASNFSTSLSANPGAEIAIVSRTKPMFVAVVTVNDPVVDIGLQLMAGDGPATLTDVQLSLMLCSVSTSTVVATPAKYVKRLNLKQFRRNGRVSIRDHSLLKEHQDGRETVRLLSGQVPEGDPKNTNPAGSKPADQIATVPSSGPARKGTCCTNSNGDIEDLETCTEKCGCHGRP